ncbi:hypothetical protein ACIBL8_43080 [Streptomyces sp. NPDC050523]|uniref:hypothetical protein n=1 Tax=Streptomyces sp. NPDC050523 TaxID=3365622 RepID=UPI0037A8A2B8
MCRLLHRHGWSRQSPARRALIGLGAGGGHVQAAQRSRLAHSVAGHRISRAVISWGAST